jgi:hypothetical protein
MVSWAPGKDLRAFCYRTVIVTMPVSVVELEVQVIATVWVVFFQLKKDQNLCLKLNSAAIGAKRI